MFYIAPNYIKKARDLRLDPTDVEKQLWGRLRARQLAGYKFRRQHPLGAFVVDFACEEEKLVIELDGGQHGQEAIAFHEQERTQWLKRQGWRVLRFWNHEIIDNSDGVLEIVRIALTQNPLDFDLSRWER